MSDSHQQGQTVDSGARYFVEIENWRRPGTWFRPFDGFETADGARAAAAERLSSGDAARLVVERTVVEFVEQI